MTEPTARAMNLPAVMPNVLKLQTIKEAFLNGTKRRVFRFFVFFVGGGGG